jgi:hypothetical protein
VAYQPCVSCHRKFIGATVYSYVTWWDGADRHSFRFRHCDACASDLRNRTLEEADARDQDGDWHTAAGELGVFGDLVDATRSRTLAPLASA